ncbi:Tkl/lisk/lisk-dd1 protein kinase, partial [Globisporangium splendens]
MSFTEFLQSVSILSSKASTDERLRFSFDILDFDRDGKLSKQELLSMLEACIHENSINIPKDCLETIANKTMDDVDLDRDSFMSFEEYKALGAANPHMLNHVTFNISGITAEYMSTLCAALATRINLRRLQPRGRSGDSTTSARKAPDLPAGTGDDNAHVAGFYDLYLLSVLKHTRREREKNQTGTEGVMSANQRGDDSRSSASECLFALEPHMIKIGKEIGKGAFSVVYSGEFNKKHVAVKCQPKDAEGNIPPYVLKEVQILQRLQHPQLLEFIGACDNRKTKQVWILSEHSNNGDIDLLLKGIRKGNMAHLGWLKMAQIALDAAMGVAFLHSQQVIHRDIKSSNILLDTNYRAKLCDFGFAMDMKASAQHDDEDEAQGKARRKSYCGTDAYMAPEMFLDEDYNESVDVFSFGVVLMELLCCRVGNEDGFLMRLPQHKFRIQVSEFYDALPESCPPVFARLAEQCVAFEPSDRPKADAIVKALKELLGQKQVLDDAAGVVELRPFTPMTKEDVECEPQMGDDDDNDDDEEDDDDDDDESFGDGGDDTVDLEADEADHSGVFSSEDVENPYYEDELDRELEGEMDFDFHPNERLAPTPPPPYHAGVILKRNRRGNRAWSSKWFTIEGDQLVYSDEIPSACDNSKKKPGSRRGSTAVLSSLSLHGCRIWKTMEMPEQCFNVINSNWKIKRELQALTMDDLEKWMDLINQGIDYANESSAKMDPVLKKQHAVSKKCASSNSSNGSTRRNAKVVELSVTKPPRSGKQPEMRDPESAKRSGRRSTGSASEAAAQVQKDEVAPTPEEEADEVYQWLKAIGCQKFTSTFKAKGYASLDFIRETGIEKEDLNFLGIKDTAARKAITTAARILRNED